MKRELKMRINKKTKKSSCIRIWTRKVQVTKKSMAKVEDREDVLTIEEGDVGVITMVQTGDKEEIGNRGETYRELCVINATRLDITPTNVLAGCLNFKKHKRTRMIAHMNLRN